MSRHCFVHLATQNPMNMATIFVVFRAFSEGGWTVYDMEGAFSTLDLARTYIVAKYANNWHLFDWAPCIYGVHSDMTKDNYWIYVGKREDCKSDCGPDGCEGGWIIEKMTVVDSLVDSL